MCGTKVIKNKKKLNGFNVTQYSKECNMKDEKA